MKNPFHSTFRRTVSHPKGFALIVTLSLMILLTIVAVALLSLSSISLRSSAQGESMQIARANARMALMIALGDLQKQLGPDTRISATADQLAGSTPETSSTPVAQRHWAGAYRSWPAAAPSSARPTPEFLQWFVSGQQSSVTNRSFASTAVSTDPKNSVQIVTPNTVGDSNLAVRVPLLTQTLTGNAKNTFGWWVSDLGTKGLIGPAKATPTAIADVRADQQVAPASNFQTAAVGSQLPFQQVSLTDAGLTRLSSWQTSALLADKPANIRGLFHDFTMENRGLITNVRAGGFRKDLSMALETTTAPNPAATALYQVGGETGINLQELWAYYSLHGKLTRTGAATFTTSGSMTSGTPHLRVADGPVACQNDDAFYMKQPVIINYQMILSLQTRPTTVNSQTMQRLHLVSDPVLTLWNPLDVPLVIPAGSFITVKYWQIPYTLQVSVNSGAFQDYPFAAILSGAKTENLVGTEQASNGDGNFMSIQVGVLDQMIFKPGEVIKWSQSGNLLAKNAGASDRHKLAGKKGFNFGGGVSMPVRDLGGRFVDLKTTDIVTCKTKPNNLTAGATPTSGKSLVGTSNHSRHFSLTHHEYYVGEDRYATNANASNTTSLGIGTMAIDWDFGNRRLKAAENRGIDAPGIAGTKPSGDRLYADMSRLSDIFKSAPGRDIPAFNLSTDKQPVMILSFEAKTENGSDTRTRFLSRFNPRALHVDFYDFSETERLMLPYEYRVEPLSSWKNRSIEVSSNGGSFFGGGMTASDGTSFVTTHSIPREPIVSLAAFQHSFANGFDIQKPKFGYGTLNTREPMLPQISHAIGNSMASPVLGPGATEGTLNGGRPVADHSYLANQGLWDDWFLSGIAPQTSNTFSKSRSQKTVATEFFSGAAALPVTRYLADLRGQDPAKLISRYIPGSTPTTLATQEIASLIRVNGMFNVNSTSVEAWKSLLGGRNGRPIVVRNALGRESVANGDANTPVAGLLAPEDRIAPGTGNASSQDPGQWVGRRTLTPPEIDRLARALVKEVRKRGPFLSLADFVNRRVGSDAELARAGAIQSALDSSESGINSAYGSVSSTTASRFTFPNAEEGPIAFGNTGVVKQADILTPIAPILSARSDSFLIRGYGERVDASGKVIARAWCEATVQRTPSFVNPADAPEKAYSSISSLNQTFGRRFEIVSFRWLSSAEA